MATDRAVLLCYDIVYFYFAVLSTVCPLHWLSHSFGLTIWLTIWLAPPTFHISSRFFFLPLT